MIGLFGGVAFDAAKPDVVQLLEGYVPKDELDRLLEVSKNPPSRSLPRIALDCAIK